MDTQDNPAPDLIHPFPGCLASGLLVLALLSFQCAGGVPFGIIQAAAPEPGALLAPWSVGLINLMGSAALLFLGGWIARRAWPESYRLTKPPPLLTLAAVPLLAVGASLLNSKVSNIVTRALSIPDELRDLLSVALGFGGDHPIIIAGSFFTVVLVAPLTEELLFRGLMLEGLLARYSAPVAILASSFLFGFIHLYPPQAVPAMLIGALFGWQYLVTRSLWPCILLHATYNVLAFSGGNGLIPFDIPGYTAEGTQSWSLTGLGLLLTAAGIAITWVGRTRRSV